MSRLLAEESTPAQHKLWHKSSFPKCWQFESTLRKTSRLSDNHRKYFSRSCQQESTLRRTSRLSEVKQKVFFSRLSVGVDSQEIRADSQKITEHQILKPEYTSRLSERMSRLSEKHRRLLKWMLEEGVDSQEIRADSQKLQKDKFWSLRKRADSQ